MTSVPTSPPEMANLSYEKELHGHKSLSRSGAGVLELACLEENYKSRRIQLVAAWAKQVLITRNAKADPFENSPVQTYPCCRITAFNEKEVYIFSTNAICSYIGCLRRNSKLCGSSFLESVEVDVLVEIILHTLEVPAMTLIYSKIGSLPGDGNHLSIARSEFMEGLQKLENQLSISDGNSYFFGEAPTIADAAALTLLEEALAQDILTELELPMRLTRWLHFLRSTKEVKDLYAIEPKIPELSRVAASLEHKHKSSPKHHSPGAHWKTHRHGGGHHFPGDGPHDQHHRK